MHIVSNACIIVFCGRLCIIRMSMQIKECSDNKTVLTKQDEPVDDVIFSMVVSLLNWDSCDFFIFFRSTLYSANSCALTQNLVNLYVFICIIYFGLLNKLLLNNKLRY